MTPAGMLIAAAISIVIIALVVAFAKEHRALKACRAMLRRAQDNERIAKQQLSTTRAELISLKAQGERTAENNR